MWPKRLPANSMVKNSSDRPVTRVTTVRLAAGLKSPPCKWEGLAMWWVVGSLISVVSVAAIVAAARLIEPACCKDHQHQPSWTQTAARVGAASWCAEVIAAPAARWSPPRPYSGPDHYSDRLAPALWLFCCSREPSTAAAEANYFFSAPAFGLRQHLHASAAHTSQHLHASVSDTSLPIVA